MSIEDQTSGAGGETLTGISPIEKATERSTARFPLIDGLRGIAAMMVVTAHFVDGSVLSPAFEKLLGPAFQIGHLGVRGVEIFFVISGFVICYSQRRDRVTPRFFGNFIVRRSLRLDPPYWVAIAIAAFSAWLSNKAFHDRVMPLPTAKDILANMFYLQDFLHQPHIISVFWTLCLEVQFYLVFTLFRGIAQRGQVSMQPILQFSLFAPLLIYSLCIHGNLLPTPLAGLFITYWFMFFLGVMICWVMTGEMSIWWFWAAVALQLAENFSSSDRMQTNCSIAAAVFVLICIQAGKINTWLKGPVLQFLGRISYSLYLLHIPIGGRFLNVGFRLTHDNPLAAAVWLVLGIGVTLIAANLMYRYVESYGVALGKRLKMRGARSSSEIQQPDLVGVET